MERIKKQFSPGEYHKLQSYSGRETVRDETGGDGMHGKEKHWEELNHSEVSHLEPVSS